MQDARNNDLIRFGAYELKKGTGELRKHGIKIRLQGKPVHLLQALLERPGEVLTREELHRRLWPADADVDFESGLNTAANRLRIALGDSADNPHYVETLARIGYRFIGPVIFEKEVRGNGVVHADAPGKETRVDVATPVIPAAPPAPVATETSSNGHGWVVRAALIAMVGLAVGAAFLVRKRPTVPLSFHQLTFRRMSIASARFGPDGQSVIYEGRERFGNRDVYMTHPSSPESRPLGFERFALASLSRAGELALITSDRGSIGELLRVPLNGGAPLPVDKDIIGADWTIDGKKMAVIRGGMSASILEFPRGKVVYSSKGWLSHVRISRDGRRVAFFEHPVRGDDCGRVKLLDGNGKVRNLTDAWASAEGLAWSPSDREIWFTAARTGVNRSLYAVDASGRLRVIASLPGTMTLFDISDSGRVLIAHDQLRLVMNGLLRGDSAETDLSWFDFSRAVGISDDGRVLLFDETGEGGGPHYSAYARRGGDKSAVRIADGAAMAISHAGDWAIVAGDQERSKLNVVPLAPGETRTISGQGLTYEWVRVFPDDKHLLAGGSAGGRQPALYVQSLDGAKPEPIKNSTYLVQTAISPDGKLVAGVNAHAKLTIVALDGGEETVIPLDFYAAPVGWSSDGKALLVQNGASVPAGIFHVDVKTGKYRKYREIAPPDLAGIVMMSAAVISRDEKAYAYSFNRTLSELFVVDGWL